MRSREEIEKIINAHKEGYTYNQIAKLFNANKSIIAFYCNTKRNRNIIERLRNEEQKSREYEELICEIVKESDNINQVCRKLNKRPTNNNYKKVNDIIKKYELDTSHFTFENSFSKKIAYYSDDEVFSNRGKLYSSYGLKKRLFNGNYKEYKCEMCGISTWLNEPISLQIHHINGNRYDNRIENLQVLCPNCHSQTENYCKSKKNENLLMKDYKTKSNEKNKKVCKQCGKEFVKINNISFCCNRCYQDYLAEKRIPLKELKDSLIRNKGIITKCCKEFNLSDKGFVKQLQKANLPFRRKAIQEWLIMA